MTIEELQLQLTELQDKLAATEAAVKEKDEQLAQAQKDIEGLREVNQKLFLRATSKPETPPSVPPPAEEFTTTDLLSAIGVKE